MKVCLVVAILFLCWNCRQPGEVETGFYVWKSLPGEADCEPAYLEKAGVKRLYVRLFDVDKKDGKALPQGVLRWKKEATPALPVVPVVFITNRTFVGIADGELEDLAGKVVAKVQDMCGEMFHAGPVGIQFDCDWTKGTRYAYFRFLELFRQKWPDIPLSVTIRLHQVKYFKATGVPPANRGVLMYYATTEPGDFLARNSILDNEEAEKYTANMRDYPLPLDIALPLFSWGIVQNPLGKIKLVSGIRQADLDGQPDCYRRESDGSWMVLKSHYLDRLWMNEGYRIRVEEVTPEMLKVAVRNLRDKRNQSTTEVVYYHLDESVMRNFPPQLIMDITNGLK